MFNKGCICWWKEFWHSNKYGISAERRVFGLTAPGLVVPLKWCVRTAIVLTICNTYTNICNYTYFYNFHVTFHNTYNSIMLWHYIIWTNNARARTHTHLQRILWYLRLLRANILIYLSITFVYLCFFDVGSLRMICGTAKHVAVLVDFMWKYTNNCAFVGIIC